MNFSTLELTNYWLPIIWVCAAGFILNMFPKQTVQHGSRVEQRWFWFSVVLLVIPLVIWAGARVRIGDTAAYRRHFLSAPASLLELPAYLKSKTKDRGFSVLMTVCKSLGVSQPATFFTIIAFVQMWGMAVTFRKYAPNFWVCIFLFVASTDYISWMFNGMRQFLATTIIFSASGLLFQGRLKPFCLVVLLASTIHGSALLMIPLAYAMNGRILNTKMLWILLGTALVMPIADWLMPALTSALENTQYNDITTNEVWATDDGTNIIRVLVYSVPALVALFCRRYISGSTDRVMSICINGALATMALYLISSVTSGIYVGRLPIYTTFYGYMALPWMLEQIFEKNSKQFVLVMMVLFYIAFYYYQMGATWGLL